MNSEKDKVCFNCQFWHLDIEALDARHRLLAQKAAGKDITVPAGLFGNCKARYVDKSGMPQQHNMGTLAPQLCIARDDRGRVLFEETAD